MEMWRNVAVCTSLAFQAQVCMSISIYAFVSIYECLFIYVFSHHSPTYPATYLSKHMYTYIHTYIHTTGKTATVHHVLARLRREKKELPFTHVEINGLRLSSPAQVAS